MLRIAISCLMVVPLMAAAVPVPSQELEARAPALSRTATSLAIESMQNLHSKMETHTQTKADVRQAVMSARFLFGNMQETGFNAWLTSYALAHRPEIEAKVASMPLPAGIPHPTPEAIERFYSQLQDPKIGMQAIEAEMIEHLSALESSPETLANVAWRPMPPTPKGYCAVLAAECTYLGEVAAEAGPEAAPVVAAFYALAYMYGIEAALGLC